MLLELLSGLQRLPRSLDGLRPGALVAAARALAAHLAALAVATGLALLLLRRFQRRRAGRIDSRLAYWRLLPTHDQGGGQAAARRWWTALAAGSGAPRRAWRHGTPWYRFLARCAGPGGKLAFFIGAPPERAGALRRAFALAAAGVELVPVEGNPTGALGPDAEVASCVLAHRGDDHWLPIRTGGGDGPDPLDALLAAMGAGELPEGSEAWLEVLFHPVPERAALQRPALAAARRMEARAADPGGPGAPVTLSGVVRGVFSDPRRPRPPRALDEWELHRVQALRQRAAPEHKAFLVALRLASSAPGPARPAGRMRAMRAGLRGYQGLNALAAQAPLLRRPLRDRVRAGALLPGEGFVLTASELAALARVPDGGSPLFPHVEGSRTRHLRAPGEIPKRGVRLGRDSLDGNRPVALPVGQLLQHCFVAGKTGSGKTSLLLTMMTSLLERRAHDAGAPGFALLDPHGDAAKKLLGHVPAPLAEQVHVLPLGPTERPRGFNFLEVEDPAAAEAVAGEFVATLRALFPGQTGVRMDHYLRHALLTLLAAPPATILGLNPLFLDARFRSRILSRLDDPVLRRFWRDEFANQKNLAEVLGPIWNRIGAFTAYRPMRHMCGQPRSTIRLREVMDQGRVLLIDGSGCPEDVKKMAGAMFLVRFHFAAQSRHSIPEERRRPFLFFADEVHLFAVPLLAKMLSEDRKFGLGLVLATQYLETLPEAVLDGILGNALTTVLFQLGGPNAALMARWTRPGFSDQDLTNLSTLHALVRTAAPTGEPLQFTIRTDVLDGGDDDMRAAMMAASDQHDGRPAAEVAGEIQALYGGGALQAPADWR